MWVLLHLAGATLAWLVQLLLGWCNSCLDGAGLAWMGGVSKL